MIVADRPSAVLQRQHKVPPDRSADKKFRQKFTYPFWNLKEGKGVKPEADDSVVLLVNGVRVHLLPDRFASEKELKKKGDTFRGKSKGLSGARTL